MKKGCLSEEILHRHSTKNPSEPDKSHYKRRSFQRTTPAPLYNWGARFVRKTNNTL